MPVRSHRILALSIMSLGIGILASGCFDAMATAGASFGVEQSLLYPPEVRARPVVVVNGGGFTRSYWDPRYALLYSRPPKRHRWAEPVNP